MQTDILAIDRDRDSELVNLYIDGIRKQLINNVVTNDMR